MSQLHLLPTASNSKLLQETRDLFQHEGSTEELIQRVLAAAKTLESLDEKRAAS